MGYGFEIATKLVGIKWTHEDDRWKATTYTEVAIPWPSHQMPPHTRSLLQLSEGDAFEAIILVNYS